MPKGSIVIKRKAGSSESKPRHIKCFEPNFFLDIKDIKFKLNPQMKQQLIDELEDRNQGKQAANVMRVTEINEVFLQKKIQVSVDRFKRAYLEVFKFFTPKAIANTLSVVCRDFYEITWSEELWHYYAQLKFSKIQREMPTWREFYVVTLERCCVSCYTYLDQDNYNFCPILKKVLCLTCFGTKHDYKYMNKQTFQMVFKIAPSRVNVEWFNGLSGTKVAYIGVLRSAVRSIRSQSKQELLNQLENRPEYDMVEKIDLDGFEDFSSLENMPHLKIIKSNRYYVHPFAITLASRSEFENFCQEFIRTAGKNRKVVTEHINKLTEGA